MKSGMQLMEAGSASIAAQVLIEAALNGGPRDLTRDEAAKLREAGGKLLCAALECERIALGIPEKARG